MCLIGSIASERKPAQFGAPIAIGPIWAAWYALLLMKKPKTAAQRKRDRQARVREEIDAAKPASANIGNSAKCQNAHIVMPPTVQNPLTTGDAFRPAYKDKLLAQLSKANSPSSTPLSMSGTTTLDPKRPPRSSSSATPSRPSTPALRIRTAGAPASSAGHSRLPPLDAPSEEEIGGLSDDDVAISRVSATRSHEKARSSQTLGVVYIEPEPPAKPKVKRTPKAEMDPSNSLSAEHLDEWVRPTFEKILMPTVLDHYGGEQDPWTLDASTGLQGRKGKKSMAAKPNGNSRDLVDVLQEMINSLYPLHFQELEFNDLLVRVRRAFFKRANNLVAAAYKAYKSKHPNATKADVSQWVKSALDPDTGFALWETPPTREDPMAHGSLLSTFVLSTFAPHISATADSHFEERPPPIGALSLALAAIDFTFMAYSTGEYVTPKKNWDNVHGGEATEWYLVDTVQPALKKVDLWSLVMERAAQFNTGQASESASGADVLHRRRRRQVLDSSPVRGDSP
ncbi:hypothetical protein LXA43DRAFT_1098816 [Ganoderma leucocontextum]|nr:hypothetical protein LXA43DRAFT_1098816 [Ganoderma leucocontextum]